MGHVKFVIKPSSSADFPLEALEKSVGDKPIKCWWKADEDEMIAEAWGAITAMVKKNKTVKLDDNTQISGLDKKLAKAAESGSLSSVSNPGKHDLTLALRGQSDEHKLKIDIAAKAGAVDDDSWEDRVSFSNAAVKGACESDSKVMKKIKSVALDPGYAGHGRTTALGAGVLHCHVTNSDGIAFKWNGDNLEVVAWGTKWDAAPDGNSGYKWTT